MPISLEKSFRQNRSLDNVGKMLPTVTDSKSYVPEACSPHLYQVLCVQELREVCLGL